MVEEIKSEMKALLPRRAYHPRYDLVAGSEPLVRALSDEERERLGGRRDEAEIGGPLDGLAEREVRLLQRLGERSVHWDET